MKVDNPNILLIDSYDSFTLNLAALCRKSIPGCRIYIIKNDEYTFEELKPYIDYFAAIVVGPGPGSPATDKDIGIVKHLWTMQPTKVIPIFGVCLGLQSLGIAFKAKLKRLPTVKHGLVSMIRHKGQDIFEGASMVKGVRYHSLCIEPTPESEVEELAWADDDDNGPVLMACKHNTRPFWAVQYHPESVLTNNAGAQVVQNFWRLARCWSATNNRKSLPGDAKLQDFGHRWPLAPRIHIQPKILLPKRQVKAVSIYAPHLSTITISELLGVHNDEEPFVALDSAASPGRFSIIAALLPSSPRITFSVGSNVVMVRQGPNVKEEELGSHDIWSWLANFMLVQQAEGGNPAVPFWGGLIGYLTYELGVDSLQVPVNRHPGTKPLRHPDVNLIFVERSVVLDSCAGVVYVQSLLEDDEMWLSDTVRKLQQTNTTTSTSTISEIRRSVATLPDKDGYIARIRHAKECLYSGDSYEICLTAPTYISTHSLASGKGSSSSWERYKILRKLNPAPHSAYLRLHPSTLISSSPERFLSFTRGPDTICQLRPIKGTVKKAAGITRAVAEQVLGSDKEVAENLMIVDLIRHDLHSVIGDNVQVKQFCSVEEYETLWQLVSVIEGKGSSRTENPLLGWDVLSRSLPPGSMTGAPKKRSVEILQSLEDAERSVYSGVFGYWCVSGGGDWSVTIRSCFKYDEKRHDSTRKDAEEQWVIGAGGAITALSDPESEWDEMVTKLKSVLRAFGAA
ncbi:ADC synthase [Amanita muscaria]